MKTKTKTVTIAAAAASVIAAGNVVDARAAKGGKAGKQPPCEPNPDDVGYGAACVEIKDPGIDCGDKSNARKKGKKKGKPLYYDGEDCVEAKDLIVEKCEGDHKAVYDNDTGEADCKIVDEGTEGCKSAEMCAQRHAKGESCPDCGLPGKIHACAGCPNQKKHRDLMADAW